MILPAFFDSRKTLQLFGQKNNFNFFKDLLTKNKFPSVTMLSGKKGIGKLTLINHLMFFYFDIKYYDLKINKLSKKSSLYLQILENSYPGIIYLDGSKFKNIKIEDVRNLRQNLQKTSIIDKKKFVIFDDVETFNHNSLNALLKVIEEPGKNIHFILINNETKDLLNTIKSRSLEFKIILNKDQNKNIIKSLTDHYNQKIVLNEELINISPGNFIKFNFIFDQNKISFDKSFLENFKELLRIYKKEKNSFYKNILIFFVDYYLQYMKMNKKIDNIKLINNRIYLTQNINEFIYYNLNSNSLINNIQKRFSNE